MLADDSGRATGKPEVTPEDQDSRHYFRLADHPQLADPGDLIWRAATIDLRFTAHGGLPNKVENGAGEGMTERSSPRARSR